MRLSLLYHCYLQKQGGKKDTARACDFGGFKVYYHTVDRNNSSLYMSFRGRDRENKLSEMDLRVLLLLQQEFEFRGR